MAQAARQLIVVAVSDGIASSPSWNKGAAATEEIMHGMQLRPRLSCVLFCDIEDDKNPRFSLKSQNLKHYKGILGLSHSNLVLFSFMRLLKASLVPLLLASFLLPIFCNLAAHLVQLPHVIRFLFFPLFCFQFHSIFFPTFLLFFIFICPILFFSLVSVSLSYFSSSLFPYCFYFLFCSSSFFSTSVLLLLRIFLVFFSPSFHYFKSLKAQLLLIFKCVF